MTSSLGYTVYVPLILSIVSLVVAVLTLVLRFLDRRDRNRTTFLIQKTNLETICILNPSKIIEKLSVRCNGAALPLVGANSRTTVTLQPLRNVCFILPQSLAEQNPELVILDGTKRLRKIRFSEVASMVPT